jgi:hypothetical protein
VKPGTRLPVEQLYKTALDKLQTKPNLVLQFSTGLFSHYGDLRSLVPEDAVLLEMWNEANEFGDADVWRGEIQSNINGNIETSSEMASRYYLYQTRKSNHSSWNWKLKTGKQARISLVSLHWSKK